MLTNFIEQGIILKSELIKPVMQNRPMYAAFVVPDCEISGKPTVTFSKD